MENVMIDMAKTIWKDDNSMQAIAIYQAKETAKKQKAIGYSNV